MLTDEIPNDGKWHCDSTMYGPEGVKVIRRSQAERSRILLELISSIEFVLDMETQTIRPKTWRDREPML